MRGRIRGQTWRGAHPQGRGVWPGPRVPVWGAGNAVGGTTLLPHLQLSHRPPERAPRSPPLSPTTASIRFRAVSAGERRENPQKSSKQDKYVVQTKAVLGGMRFRLLPDGVDPSEAACGLRKMRHLLLSAGLIASATPKRAHAGGARSEGPGSGRSLASRSPMKPCPLPSWGLAGLYREQGDAQFGVLGAAFKPSPGYSSQFPGVWCVLGPAGVDRNIIWATPRPHQSVAGGWGVQAMFQVGKSGATRSASPGLECRWVAGGGGGERLGPAFCPLVCTPATLQAPRPLGFMFHFCSSSMVINGYCSVRKTEMFSV